ncbi:Spermidine synthase [Paenibacillus sophorae]|uniref:Spermidine synthase n=1 Tax=Paenibacillus sophorae TaxID=1333845 RepID=A0A1H8UP25_9BACL|nr:fused MFS/spermidine synthase [Paenibacillus sophorae]QWU13310.1 fused MFS/spermidine synthase [Paenibacillus sophorae]SEP04358.1 Spermidine synthase [Paenibacillus sophorae]
MKLLYNTCGDGHAIKVYDTDELYGEKGRFRVLQFSEEAVQGAVDLDCPERIVFEYPRAIIHLMELNNPEFEDAFIIGHGIGTISGYFSGKKIKTAEIGSQIEEISRTYFGYSGDHVRVGDGRRKLEQERDGAFDYIVLDAFSDKGTPRHLMSEEFFRLVRAKLNPYGIMLMNLMGKGGNDRLIQAVYTTLASIFPHTQAFVLPSEGASTLKNMILAGSSRPIAYKARQMAGFIGTLLPPGHILSD